MRKVLSAVIAVVAIAIAFVVFPIITDATTDLLTDEYTQTVASATAVDGKYQATLSHDVFDNKTGSVLSVTSNEATDNPVVVSVNEKQVTISGLDSSEATRDLTIKYQSGALGDYVGLEAIVKITPMLIYVVMILGLVVGVLKTGRD